MGSRATSGRFGVSTLALAWLASACYSFAGGGGFPSDVRTIYISPFENRTVQFDLGDQIFSRMTETLPRALGVRPAGEQIADAIVRGRIVRYEDVAQAYQPGQQGNVQVLQNQITVVVSVEIIDVKRNLILWESTSVTGRGEYRPDSQNDQAARTKAIEALIQQIVDGAQSQW